MARLTPSPYSPGDVVGHWLLIKEAPPDKYAHYFWEARCTKCNSDKVYIVQEYHLKAGKSSHCRSCTPGRKHLPPRVRVGDKKHHWTVVKDLVWLNSGPNGKRRRHINIQCRCGHLRAVREHYFFAHLSRSCGCMRGMEHILQAA